MCIIAVSAKGVRQPTIDEIEEMFYTNPHGAGYMVARDGSVEIHKGYMDVEHFLKAIESENFTEDDAVVYHFRISTQAGVNPQMTHPFPWTRDIEDTKVLDCVARCGIVHNGVISLTTNKKDKMYSDTAHFIPEYLTKIITKPSDLKDQEKLDKIYGLAQSKFAIMDGSGYIATVGNFIEEDGVLFSNGSYKSFTFADVINSFHRRERKFC